MSRRLLAVGALAAFALLGGCGSAGRPLVFGKVDEVRGSPLAEAAKAASPALWQKAEKLRLEAQDAASHDDAATAQLLAEHAIAAYEHAFAAARLRVAMDRKEKESDRLTRARERFDADEKARIEIDREADDMEATIAVRNEALSPSKSQPTDPAREVARWIAARANLATAEALCAGAELLAATAKGLADAKTVLATVETSAQAGKGEAPIDPSTRARAMCLKALTAARDIAVAGNGPSGDELLKELSGMGGYDPYRDERGVVATLPQLPSADATFDASGKLTAKGKQRLDDLGRVANTHATFAVLVVVHAAGTANAARDKARADLAKQTLVAAGADPTKVGVETPGTQLPLYDPNDAKNKAKNERVEVIFVGGSK